MRVARFEGWRGRYGLIYTCKYVRLESYTDGVDVTESLRGSPGYSSISFFIKTYQEPEIAQGNKPNRCLVDGKVTPAKSTALRRLHCDRRLNNIYHTDSKTTKETRNYFCTSNTGIARCCPKFPRSALGVKRYVSVAETAEQLQYPFVMCGLMPWLLCTMPYVSLVNIQPYHW